MVSCAAHAGTGRQAYRPYLAAYTNTVSSQAQTPQQRRANAKFFKEQEANRGKSKDEIKKKTKETFKSPISPLWLGTLALSIAAALMHF
ncbi:hypothetical protein CONLIGDRAFT_631676, partial [Coniochaeta ligniaria NRRL 30616]